MHSNYSEIALLSEEEVRNARLARGLRAVAASVIVGGLVVVIVETMVPTSRSVAINAPAIPAPARAMPLATPAALPEAAPAPGDIDPLLRRMEEGVTQHG